MRATLLLLLVLAAGVQECRAHGAVAVGSSGAEYKFATSQNHWTEEGARNEAMRNCSNAGLTNCHVFRTFENTCLGVAIMADGISISDTADTETDAKVKVLSACRSNTYRSLCTYFAGVCDQTPVAAGTKPDWRGSESPRNSDFSWLPIGVAMVFGGVAIVVITGVLVQRFMSAAPDRTLEPRLASASAVTDPALHRYEQNSREPQFGPGAAHIRTPDAGSNQVLENQGAKAGLNPMPAIQIVEEGKMAQVTEGPTPQEPVGKLTPETMALLKELANSKDPKEYGERYQAFLDSSKAEDSEALRRVVDKVIATLGNGKGVPAEADAARSVQEPKIETAAVAASPVVITTNLAEVTLVTLPQPEAQNLPAVIPQISPAPVDIPVVGPSPRIQLKLTRSQRQGLTGKVIFALNARIEIPAEERALIAKYRLGDTVIYDSEARTRHREAALGHLGNMGEATAIADTTGALRSIGKSAFSLARAGTRAAMAILSLRITISSLMKGVHVECKDMDELLATKDAIVEAAENLRSYLNVAATFDGREEIIEF
jgi:Domain of unknown function (DUF4189)